MKLTQEKLREIIKEEIERLDESSNFKIKIHSINGEEFFLSVNKFTSPETDSNGFIQELRDLKATAPNGYASAEAWIKDNQTRNLSSTANIKVDSSIFKKYYKKMNEFKLFESTTYKLTLGKNKIEFNIDDDYVNINNKVKFTINEFKKLMRFAIKNGISYK